MSTVPGDRTWRDAGLVEPALTDLPEVDLDDAPDEGEDEYTPREPDPDPMREADPADVVEQAQPVPGDERDDYP